MNYFMMALKRYADFSGRSRRKEYWFFTLFDFILLIVAGMIDMVLGISFIEGGFGYGPFYLLFALAMLIPGLAVSVRRMHDVGKSGWFLLIALIPLIGAIWILVLLVTDSQAGENEYGPNPKAETLAIPENDSSFQERASNI